MKEKSFHIDEIELDAMRSDIKEQYPQASDSRRAVLLSNLLWKKLKPYFCHFSDHEQKRLMLELFQSTLISNRPLTADEINGICQQYCPLDIAIQASPVAKTFNTDEQDKEDVIEKLKDVKTWSSLGLTRYFSLLLLLFLLVASALSLVALLRPVAKPKAIYALSFVQYNQMRHLSELPIKLVVSNANPLRQLEYRPLNRERAFSLLALYDSVLMEDTYLDTLESVAKSQNIHPALILSIIGQEQGFIPRTSPFKAKIINNPYNLFGSWEKKQITFEKSTEICCRLVIRLLETCPADSNPFLWINHTYAEDDNWHIGVGYFFAELTKD